MPKTSTSGANNSFEAFLEGWLARQEHYLDELLTAQQNSHQSSEEYLTDLVNRVLCHYQQYYQEKSLFVRQNDVFLVFSPTWFTAFEHAFLWIAGFRPGLTFRIVKDSIDDLSEEQIQRMSRVIAETRVEERVLCDSMAQIQESLAAPPLLELAKQCGRRLVDGVLLEQEERMEEEMGKLKSAMESVVGRADNLRTSTVVKMVEILEPRQNLKFLTAVTKLQLTIRRRGLEKEDGSRESGRDSCR